MNTNQLSAAQKKLIKEQAAWFRDVRETSEKSVKQFATLLNLTNKVVRDIESEKVPLDEWIMKTIARRTGRRFGENLEQEVINLQKVAEPEAIPGTPPILDYLEVNDKRKPLVKVRPEALAARQKILNQKKKPVDRQPRNDVERTRVSKWIQEGLKRERMTQPQLAERAGLKIHTLRDLIYCNSRMSDETKARLIEVIGPASEGEPVSPPIEAYQAPPDIIEAINKIEYADNCIIPGTADFKQQVKKLTEFEVEMIDKLVGVTVDEMQEFNFGSPFSLGPQEYKPRYGLTDDAGYQIVPADQYERMLELAANTETYPRERVKPMLIQPKARQIECIELKKTFSFVKDTPVRTYNITLEVDLRRKTFTIFNHKGMPDMIFKGSHDTTMCLAVADLIRAAVERAEYEFSLIP